IFTYCSDGSGAVPYSTCTTPCVTAGREAFTSSGQLSTTALSSTSSISALCLGTRYGIINSPWQASVIFGGSVFGFGAHRVQNDERGEGAEHKGKQEPV